MANNQKTVCSNKKKACGKTVAFVFIAVCLLIFVLPFKYLATGAGLELKSGIFFKMLGATFGGDGKFLFLPVISSSVLGLATSACVYLLLLGLITTIVLSVLAIAKPKHTACFIKAATFVFTWSVAIYSLSVLIITSYMNSVKVTIDPISFILAVLGAIFYFTLLYKEYKCSAWLLAGQFLLSLLAAGFLFLAMTHNGKAVADAVRSPSAKLLLALSAVAAMASVAITSVVVLKVNKWTAILQLINTIAMLALSLCVALLSRFVRMSNITYLFFSLSAAVVSFVQILLCVFNFYIAGKKEDSDLDALLSKKYDKEEYVEVLPYNGDATGAQVAQLAETNAPVADPAAVEIPDDPAKEALFEGKDDAFIATLSKEEKYEFADLYVLKTKGGMAGIPTYEIGGENKAFFSKVFVYLSQYREKISSSLLAKIYDYSQKD